ncbi:MAG TPA: RNA methyltransferase [Solirubrobacteraceae bacterium]|nr:RNA methyltransferase [Solirubrobacteraceae bacterium]
MITSPHNEKLKEIRKLAARRRVRSRSGRFVAEGEDLLSAADAAGWEPVVRLCAAGSGLAGEPVAPEVLAGVSGLRSGCRTLAVYEERWAVTAVAPCVYLHGVHDPGNVGTVLRSGAAFGAGCVALGPGSADPFSPNAVRASMGAVFEVPVAQVTSLDQLPRPLVALDAGRGEALWEITSTWVQKAPTFLVGAEREGLPAEILAEADHIAHIPIRTHSLNAAMAATIALYEVSRMAPA